MQYLNVLSLLESCKWRKMVIFCLAPEKLFISINKFDTIHMPSTGLIWIHFQFLMRHLLKSITGNLIELCCNLSKWLMIHSVKVSLNGVFMWIIIQVEIKLFCFYEECFKLVLLPAIKTPQKIKEQKLFFCYHSLIRILMLKVNCQN